VPRRDGCIRPPVRRESTVLGVLRGLELDAGLRLRGAGEGEKVAMWMFTTCSRPENAGMVDEVEGTNGDASCQSRDRTLPPPRPRTLLHLFGEMLALDYGSDSENDDALPTDAVTSASSSVAKLASGKTSLSLPPPAAGTSSSAQGKRTKKIAIAIPDLPKLSADDAVEEPPAKKPRLTKGTGAGVSALLSMLPAPKKVTDAPPPRVLGGGKGKALQFSAPPIETADNTSHEDEVASAVPSSSLPFRPASLVKGRKNINVEDSTSRPSISKPAEPAVDFFSLGPPCDIPFTRVLKLTCPRLGLLVLPQVCDFECQIIWICVFRPESRSLRSTRANTTG
jgi:hypothetical protein